MAGDWIKLEHSTPDKPEVHRMADLMGVKADEVIGMLTRFWIWLDRNSCNGHVTHVYAKSLESIMHTPGFVAAMTDVGWLELNEKTGMLTIPNPDRHSFHAAKSRALTRERVKRLRNGSVTLTPLPEKRREEKSIKEKGIVAAPPKTASSKINGASRATRLPADWFLPDDWRDWAVAAYHLDPQAAVRMSLAFRDWFLQKPGSDGTSLDWRRRWQVWVRREMERNHA